jgi:hypothetical protein
MYLMLWGSKLASDCPNCGTANLTPFIKKIKPIYVNYNNISQSLSTLVLQEECCDHTAVKEEVKQQKSNDDM